MYVPLHPTCSFDSYISGEVMIDPSGDAPGATQSPNSQTSVQESVWHGVTIHMKAP